MYIDFEKDVDRTTLPKYLSDLMDELDTYYKNDEDDKFGLILNRVITFTDSAYANHKINDKTCRIIRERYGIL